MKRSNSSMNIMNRYWLFDLAIAVAIAASVGTACKSCLFPSLPAESNPLGYCDNDLSPVTAEPAFDVGDVVEVHDPSVHAAYSFLARIENVRVDDNRDDCSEDPVRYDVVLGFGGEGYSDLAPSNLRPHSPFSPKSKAICENGKSLGATSTPCTVNHAISKRGKFFGDGHDDNTPWLYSVTFDEGGEEVTMNLPVSRIRRIVGDASEVVQAPVSSPTNDKAARSLRQEPSSSDADAEFPVGTVVELYGDGAYFAFPATVTSHSEDGRYELTHGINRAPMHNISPEFLHPYSPYPVGTEASCNLGKMRKIIMVPCTIIGHADRPKSANAKDDDVIYQVKAKSVGADGRIQMEGEERTLFLPRLRVQRVVKKEAESS